MRKSLLGRGGLVGLAAFTFGGCVLFAAGAGAGGGVYFTTRGVESVVPASVKGAFAATKRAFRHFGVEQTSLKVEEDGAKREVKGRLEKRAADVTVKLEEADGSTRIEVTARTSLVTWDKDLAREIIEKIVELAS
jgi:hypothetical protein